MTMKTRATTGPRLTLAAFAWCLLQAGTLHAQPVMEHLGRGVVAVRSGVNSVYVSWRLLATDPADVAFNLYRTAGDGKPVRLNPSAQTKTTDFVDASFDPAVTNAYTVRAVVNGRELEPGKPFVLPANAAVRQYLTVPLRRPSD